MANISHYKKNKAYYDSYRIKYAKKNRDRLRKYHSAFYQKNKKRLDLEHAERAKRNKVAYAKTRRAYYKRNRIKILSQTKVYLAIHRKKFLKLSRSRGYKHRYGVSLDYVKSLYLKQKGLCALCNDKMRELAAHKRTKNSPVLDHCHNENKIRGIIHHKCNMVIGFSNDDAVLLRKAATYLDKFKQEE